MYSRRPQARWRSRRLRPPVSRIRLAYVWVVGAPRYLIAGGPRALSARSLPRAFSCNPAPNGRKQIQVATGGNRSHTPLDLDLIWPEFPLLLSILFKPCHSIRRAQYGEGTRSQFRVLVQHLLPTYTAQYTPNVNCDGCAVEFTT